MTTKELKGMSNAARRKADYDRLLHIISEGQKQRGGIFANYKFVRKDDNNDGTIMVPWINI